MSVIVAFQAELFRFSVGQQLVTYVFYLRRQRLLKDHLGYVDTMDWAPLGYGPEQWSTNNQINATSTDSYSQIVFAY